MTDPRLAVVILAAGAGTRMKSATPKLLHELAGLPLLAHVLTAAGALEAAHVETVVRFERDRVAEVVAEHLPDAVLVDQDEVPGTGRALEQAVEALPNDFDGEVLVINGDVPLLDAPTLAGLVTAHREAGTAATVMTTVVDDATGYGRIVRSADGGLDRIVEHRDAGEAERALDEINTGAYVFGVSALRDFLARLTTDNAQGEKYLTDIVGLLRAAGADVCAYRLGESWKAQGVNDRAQLAELAARLNALIVRAWQLAGVAVQDPATTWIDLKVRLEPDVTILPNTQLCGATTVSAGATIGPDTTLRDCEVGADARVVRTDATLAVVGAGASVGPFAYLRPGTTLDDGGKIGTFVETKNARIGARAKIPHLSYVGDATVGEGANIGAGTIFANYDGVDKHPTVVGSHVRTGANNTFVAPVRIGDGAYTGAGTTVRQDVPAGALAVSTALQKNTTGWTSAKRPGTPAASAAEAATEE